MYFILRGSIEVIKDGVTLATLEQGSHFGEMALAERKPTIRTASALCITPVSVGYLSIQNFNIICGSYPIFEAKITEEVEKRKQDLIHKTKNAEKSKGANTNKRSSIASRSLKKSQKGSQKGSRQSAYEIEDDQVKPRFGSSLNTFEKPGEKSNNSASRVDKRNSAVVNHEATPLLPDSGANQSQAMMIVKENPNDPDSAVIADQHAYHGNINNILDEESESYSSNKSLKRSRKSRKSSKSKASSNKSSFEIDEGEAIVKASKGKCKTFRKYKDHFTLLNMLNFVILCLVVYNIVFIPLQAAFRFDFHPSYIVLEVFTLIFYFIDIIVIFKAHGILVKRLKDLNQKDLGNDKHLWRSIEDEKKDVRRLRIYIFLNILSIIPFSLFFWLIDVDEPLLVIYYLKMTRLLKLKPLIELFNRFKQKALNTTRIIEMLFYYYVSCHIIA